MSIQIRRIASGRCLSRDTAYLLQSGLSCDVDVHFESSRFGSDWSRWELRLTIVGSHKKLFTPHFHSVFAPYLLLLTATSTLVDDSVLASGGSDNDRWPIPEAIPGHLRECRIPTPLLQ